MGVFGIRSQLAARECYRIKEGGASSICQFLNPVSQFSRLRTEVLSDRGLSSKTFHESEVGGAIQDFLDKLSRRVFLKRKAVVHGTARVHQESQPQRQLCLRDELHYLFRRLVVITDLDI